MILYRFIIIYKHLVILNIMIINKQELTSNNNLNTISRTFDSIEKYRHIFIDHSNIYVGAKSYYNEYIHNNPNHLYDISINCKEFIQLLEKRNFNQKTLIIGMRHIIGKCIR